MRVFQPVLPDEIESGPYTFVGNKILITSRNGDKINTTTAMWGGVGYVWDKRVVFVFIRNSKYVIPFSAL